MPVANDAFQGERTGIQRGRGGFLRNSADVPYITDPTGATVKSGARKGEPKRLPYGSPSNRGKQIENTTNLVKWGERRVVLGLGVATELVADCQRLAGLELDSDEYKTLADSIIIRAKDAAKAGLAADRGTHGHALTEDHDQDRDWIARAETGEVLGVPRDAQEALVTAWREMLEREGLEILAVEASCVDDTWRLAGTLDRIARTTRPLRFALAGGEVVTIPAGEVVVLDVKSGQRRTDRNGVVQYWQAYAIQIASYAQSVPYDTETETRGEWPWPISQEHALIAHLDVLGAIEGNPSCELVYVDLVAGREHGGATVVAAKAWEQRADVFSVARLDDEIAEVATPGEVGATSAPIEPPETPLPPSPVAEPTAATTSPAVEQQAAGAAPEAPAAELSPLRKAQAERARIDAEAEAKRRLHTTPEEGDMSDANTFASLQAHYLQLPTEAREWIIETGKQADAAGVGFSAKHSKTVRRFEILRALVHMARNGEADDTSARNYLECVVGPVAQFANVAVGHVVGSLSATEAAQFAGLVTGSLRVEFLDDGRLTLRPAA